MTEPHFTGKNTLPEKTVKNSPKAGFLYFLRKLCHLFFLKMVLSEFHFFCVDKNEQRGQVGPITLKQACPSMHKNQIGQSDLSVL